VLVEIIGAMLNHLAQINAASFRLTILSIFSIFTKHFLIYQAHRH
jgi:hypothetical protein